MKKFAIKFAFVKIVVLICTKIKIANDEYIKRAI